MIRCVRMMRWSPRSSPCRSLCLLVQRLLCLSASWNRCQPALCLCWGGLLSTQLQVLAVGPWLQLSKSEQILHLWIYKWKDSKQGSKFGNKQQQIKKSYSSYKHKQWHFHLNEKGKNYDNGYDMSNGRTSYLLIHWQSGIYGPSNSTKRQRTKDDMFKCQQLFSTLSLAVKRKR